MQKLKIYTDGACANNQSRTNAGGWGAILEYGSAVKELCGGEADTTNNRMEMMAMIEAFSALKRPGLTIDVFSDSSYVISCFRDKWYVGWQKNGWKTASREPVKNKELWVQLLELTAPHNISFYLVKGHVDVHGSEAKLKKGYERFINNNGSGFRYEDYLYITEKNNRADELANIGMEPYKK